MNNFSETNQARQDLTNALESRKSDDVVTEYKYVACAFPSNAPHPRTFEYNIIDSKRLLDWAEQNGWEVNFTTPDDQAEEDKGKLPQVRFTKK